MSTLNSFKLNLIYGKEFFLLINQPLICVFLTKFKEIRVKPQPQSGVEDRRQKCRVKLTRTAVSRSPKLLWNPCHQSIFLLQPTKKKARSEFTKYCNKTEWDKKKKKPFKAVSVSQVLTKLESRGGKGRGLTTFINTPFTSSLGRPGKSWERYGEVNKSCRPYIKSLSG